MDKYQTYIEQIFERNYLTNQGPCVEALQKKLAEYLEVDYLLLVSNGTQALHVAYAVMGIKNVITTPFTFAATPGSLAFQNIDFRFSDIDESTFNLCPQQIKQQDLVWADAILPVHVFGNPCDVESIQRLAQLHNLKVIYDAAHCFGSKYDIGSLLKYGDCATLSLHATKLFHCVEGGAVIFKCKADFERAKQLINFGQNTQNIPVSAGTNAKLSEVHGAMGLALFEHVNEILAHRQQLFEYYCGKLVGVVKLQQWHPLGKPNGAYMPVLLGSEALLESVQKCLSNQGIQTRRYFYPSLNSVTSYRHNSKMPISDDISSRVLCLPMYYDLTKVDVDIICDALQIAIKNY
nr:DegT/DnrJ/EryC1/StrS family aminotransferase [Pseudoalteromonas sp. MMG013]